MLRFILIRIVLAATMTAAAWLPTAGAQTQSIPATTQAAPAEPPATQPAHRAVAYICLQDEILDSPPDFSLLGDANRHTLRDWIRRLTRARNDAAITAVALEINNPVMTWAQAQELAASIRQLNEVKPVYAFLTSGSAKEYLVASAARHVSMEPSGLIEITGIGAELMFYQGTLDLIGVKAQMIQIGRYKGAAEPMTRNKPSPEMIDMYNWLLDDLYDQMCSQIAQQRNLKVDLVKDAIDAGPLAADEAHGRKFVDELVESIDWPDFINRRLAGEDADDVEWREEYGAEPAPSIDLSNPFALFKLLAGQAQTPEIIDPTIAIVHVDGVIVSGKGGESILGERMAGDKDIVEALEEVRTNERVKAVILRVNSPGGSALSSELIYQAVARCAKDKPVVASISDIGASGGYYVAVGAPTIYADGAAIVGSVGVISGKLALSGLMEKIGVTTYEITRGRNAGLEMSRAWTAEEQDVIRRHADKTYNLFVKRVAASRGRKIRELDSVTQGRVFTARQGAANGLVDHVGGLREAVLAAASAAGVQSPRYISLPRPHTLLDVLAGPTGVRAPAAPSAELLTLRQLVRRSPGLRYLAALTSLLEQETILAAMPYYLSIRR